MVRHKNKKTWFLLWGFEEGALKVCGGWKKKVGSGP